MKNLKIVAFLILAMSACLVSKAQTLSSASKKIQAGINLEGAFPTGDFSNAYSFGIGGSLMGRYALSGKANLTASIGYLSFSGKSIKITSEGDGEDGGSGTTTTKIKLPSMHGVPLRIGAN